MRQKTVKVTPRMAEAWLQKNVVNRPLRATVVDTYANAMRRGEWLCSPEGIAFDSAGNLQNGQHRLNAVIQSGITAEMVVWEDVPPEVFNCTDTGLKRSVGDVLGVNCQVSSIAAFMAKLDDPDIRGSVTAQIALPYVTAFSTYLANLLDGHSSISKTWTAAAVRCAAILKIADGERVEYVRGVYQALCSREFDLMPPVARTLFKQSLDGAIKNRNDLFARCLMVFTEAKAGTSRIQIVSTESALKYGRQVVREVMDGKEKALTRAPKVKVKKHFTAV